MPPNPDKPSPVTVEERLFSLVLALIGQTVGSQIVAVIPPDQGYGDKASGTIPAGSTLIFVVDILGVN